MVAIAAVRKALERQAPEYADLEVSQLSRSSGTDNHIFKLGDDFCVRIPANAGAARQLKKEVEYLPYMQRLPLRVPEPILSGRATSELGFDWAIYAWVDGRDLLHEPAPSSQALAGPLSEFLKALWAIDPANGPLAGDQNHHRGVALSERDQLTRGAIQTIRDEIPEDVLTKIWSVALAVDPFAGAPKWLHGDLHPANLIAKEGELSGIIDWGLMGLGDLAVDLMPAWSLLSPHARIYFRQATEVDDATWNRGRGWALSVSAIAYAYYRDRPDYWLNAVSLKTLNQLVDEVDAS
ncbi:MAG: aminoglycoside phosphotransferase family protein [Pseudomonadota bacterium]